MNLVAKKINSELFEDFFKLKSDPVNIAWTGFEEPPNKEKLYIWFERQINNPKRDIFLFYDNNVCVGYSYIDYISEFTIEESVGVYSEFSGKGFASEITKFEVDLAIEKGMREIDSWISESNVASIKRLLKFGFEKKTASDERNLPLLGGIHKFYLYKKSL